MVNPLGKSFLGLDLRYWSIRSACILFSKALFWTNFFVKELFRENWSRKNSRICNYVVLLPVDGHIIIAWHVYCLIEATIIYPRCCMHDDVFQRICDATRFLVELPGKVRT